MGGESLIRGDRIQYIGPRAADGKLDAGAIGWVRSVAAGRVAAVWPSGIRSVPVGDVQLLGPEVARVVVQAPNARMWAMLGEELPPLSTGRQRDPYINQGCHPDIVSRVWDELGKALAQDCRAQANGKPVLAHLETDRIIALAHGTAYALWLTDEDFAASTEAGAETTMVWSGGSRTDLAEVAGPGWIWGRWYEPEPEWLRRSYLAAGRTT